MVIPVLNVIHIPKERFEKHDARHLESVRREHNFKSQCFENKITYGVWDGIIDKELPWRGISQAHKTIVQVAKDNGLNCVIIAEDDFQLRPRGWKAFTESINGEFDILLAGISGGEVNEQTKEVTGWSGLFLYCVHHRFYDAFLAADENLNIDRWLSTPNPDKEKSGIEKIEKMLGRKPVYKVCWPMAAITRDGISFKSGEYVDHGKHFSPYQVL